MGKMPKEGLQLTSRWGYGKGFIGPSIAGKIGDAFPRRSSSNISSGMTEEGPILSVEELKSVFSSNDWKKMLDAANELGKRVAGLDDPEALGFVVRFCESEHMRAMATSKLAIRMRDVNDPRVLEAIALNSDEDRERRDAIRVLGQRAADATYSYTLVHIAVRSRHESSRIAAVNCLEMRLDELKVVAEHSEYPSTRDYAKSKLPKPEQTK
ncbi:MAG: hypothetical protein V1861_04980 [Candidatus Micrarchaeota archaeon]